MTKTVNINRVLKGKPVPLRITYRPEVKDGLQNWAGEVFTYERCHIIGEFTSGGYPAGFQAVVDGGHRRFSYCNVVSVEVCR